MRIVKRTYAVLLIMAALFCGCGSEAPKFTISEEVKEEAHQVSVVEEHKAQESSNEEPVVEESALVEPMTEETVIEETVPEELTVEETVEEIKEPQILNFVDVHGKEYETEIQEGFPKHVFGADNFTIDGERTSYEDDTYYSRFGIDVSNKQKDINWEKVKNAGVEFAIIRLGYRGYGRATGDVNIDLRFHKNIKAASEQNLDIGVYFFSQAVNEEEAVEEADFVLKNLDGYELQLPVVYDPEHILNDDARTDDVTGEQFTKNAIAFCERIKEAGYEPMIYSNMLWEAFQFDMDALTDYKFWYADYEPLPQTPYDFVMWQYSEKGHVDGIVTGVDLDIQFIKK